MVVQSNEETCFIINLLFKPMHPGINQGTSQTYSFSYLSEFFFILHGIYQYFFI